MQLRKVISRCEISFTGTGTVLPADKYFSVVAQLDFELIGERFFRISAQEPTFVLAERRVSAEPAGVNSSTCKARAECTTLLLRNSRQFDLVVRIVSKVVPQNIITFHHVVRD